MAPPGGLVERSPLIRRARVPIVSAGQGGQFGMRISKILLVALVALGPAVLVTRAQEDGHDGAKSDAHVALNESDMKWGDAPPSLPKGAKAVVLSGDPGKEGEFTLRLKMPKDYKIPAHWHPTSEHVTVISGTFHIGTGDKLDAAAGKELKAGGFTFLPAKTHHFAWATEETVVQVHGMGPFAINYLNPDDDPRNKK
jgi:quercetin dioxygenase-like cupin family protein